MNASWGQRYNIDVNFLFLFLAVNHRSHYLIVYILLLISIVCGVSSLCGSIKLSPPQSDTPSQKSVVNKNIYKSGVANGSNYTCTV